MGRVGGVWDSLTDPPCNGSGHPPLGRGKLSLPRGQNLHFHDCFGEGSHFNAFEFEGALCEECSTLV